MLIVDKVFLKKDVDQGIYQTPELEYVCDVIHWFADIL